VTELDAYTYATQDATQDTPRLQAAKTPTELADAIFNRMLYRIKGMNDGEAHRHATEAYRAPEAQPSAHFSLFLASKAIAVMEASEPHLHPEDTRAMLIWLSGSQEHGPGYLQHLIHQLPDSGTQIALQQLGSYAARTFQGLNQRDQHMFGTMIKSLPHGAARAVRGLLMEAKWCNADEDGEGARIKIIGARRLAEQLIKNQLRSDRYFYDAA
jgi:hypothetical protein